MSASVHLLATIIWGIYGIVVGALAIVQGYTGVFVWISVIVSVTGNSAHLVTFAWSQKGLTVSSSQSQPVQPDISGRQVVNGSGQVVGTIK